MKRAIPNFVTSFTLAFCTLADEGRRPRLEAAGAGQRIEPLAVAPCQFADGRLTRLGDWMVPTGTVRGPQFVYAYDCFESDTTDLATLVPTDDAPPGGCTAMLPAGQRWHFQADYNNPFVSADLTTSIPGAGRMCEGLVHAWLWDVGSLEPDHDGDGRPDAHCFILFQTFETMDTLTCTDDGSGSLDALVVDLGFLPTPAPDTFYYVALDLTSIAVVLTMPADGAGGYHIRYFIDVPPAGPPVPTPGHDLFLHRGVSAQPMLWGTADAEPILDNRAGYQNAGQFDDDLPSDGIHSLGCYPDGEDYDYGIYGLCPDPLGAATGFLYVGAECRCSGDLNADGAVTKEDLALLLAQFGRTCPCENECIDIDRDETIDLGDLAYLLSAFGTVCP